MSEAQSREQALPNRENSHAPGRSARAARDPAPNVISEDRIEQALRQKLPHGHGYDGLNCHTEERENLASRSPRTAQRDVRIRPPRPPVRIDGTRHLRRAQTRAQPQPGTGEQRTTQQPATEPRGPRDRPGGPSLARSDRPPRPHVRAVGRRPTRSSPAPPDRHPPIARRRRFSVMRCTRGSGPAGRAQCDHGGMWPGGDARPCAQKIVAALKTKLFFGPGKIVAV